MKLVLPIILSAYFATALTVERLHGHRDITQNEANQWEIFKSKFNKNYSTQTEHDNRLKIFINHLRKFDAHNSDASKTYKMGVNQFTDLTWDEFRNEILMTHPKKMRTSKTSEEDSDDQLPWPEESWEFACPKKFEGATIPENFSKRCDWRHPNYNPKNLVADVGVKNQASCGSCYVFSAVAAMEGSLCLNGHYDCSNGNWSGLSEQMALNCASYDETVSDRTWERSYGCSGGWQTNVLQYVYKTGGIISEDQMPYLSGDRSYFDNKYNIGTCPYTWETQADFLNKNSQGRLSKDICGTTNKGGIADANLMKQALFSKGPLAISMYVGDNFRHVHSGIYIPDETDSSDCPHEDLLAYGTNHAMAAVAYRTAKLIDEEGNEKELEYWVIKNSWDTTFAEEGYVNVIRGRNACGIEGNISYVEMEKSE